MRIIAGSLRGRTLKSTTTSMLRPTTDRVRESIFNILSSRFDIEGVEALDLFAGTGALGIEALSRGAGSCTFVESDRKAASVIAENLRSLDLQNLGEVALRDVMKYIGETDKQFDLLFADPPYASRLFESLIDAIGSSPLVRPGGVVLLEHAATMKTPLHSGLELIVERRFGETGIALYTRVDSSVPS